MHPLDVNFLNRPFERHSGPRIALNWRVLGILNLYRMLVPLVLLGLYSLGGSRGLAVDYPAAVLRRLALLSGVRPVQRRFGAQAPGDRPFANHSPGHVDIASLMLLLHACGGIASGLGLLLLVPVAGWHSCCRRAAPCSWQPSPPSRFWCIRFGSS